MSYSIFRNMVKRCEDGDTSRKLLQDPGPDVVVADEAHLLKNEDAQVPFHSLSRTRFNTKCSTCFFVARLKPSW